MSDIINEQGPLPSDFSSTSKIDAIPAVGDEQKDLGNQENSFASLMQNKGMQPAQASPKIEAVSPFDLAGLGAKPIAAPNTSSLMNQTRSVQSTLETIHGQLSTPNLKLKSSQKYLVQNKLTDVNNHLKSANAKMGISPGASQEDLVSSKPTGATGPIAQYLGYVTDGMNQLDAAKQQLSSISQSGKNLAPADFMLLQLKFNKAQQELDFTSAILGKSIEGLKTIMGVQI